MEQIISRFAKEFATPFHSSVLIFTVILFIIFISPLLLRRIKVPGIIVLILSGLVVGPNGVNLIEKNDAVDLFSTIGLLYIMFLAGLELNFAEFSRNKHKSITFGFFTFITPLMIGFPACYYILDYSFLSSLLIASMFSTHTLIAYPIVSKMDLSKNEAVAVAVGGTIITDTAVLMILATISSVQAGASGLSYWISTLLSFSLFFLFIFKIVPIVAHWTLKRVENERYSHFIFVLATVFFSSFVAELAGLEAIIGAFMSGLVINKLIPKTSPLMHRIEFVGNALFIPFFLISIGMIIDLKSLLSGHAILIVAAILIIVALFSKWLAAYLTGVFLKYSVNQRNLIFGLSSAHAVATLAVITVGYSTGLIDMNVLNGTVLLILVTCMVSSIITEKAGRLLIINNEVRPPVVEIGEPDRILVPIANPSTMTDLMDLALNLSEPKSNTPVYALSVVDDDSKVKEKLKESREILNKLIKHASETEREIEIISTIDQNISNGIRRILNEVAGTSLVLGASPRTRLTDLIFGNLVTNILNQTNQEVFIYKAATHVMSLNAVHILCLPYTEMEYGYKSWVRKMAIFAHNLNLHCHFYGDESLIIQTKQTVSSLKITLETTYHVSQILQTESIGTLKTNKHDLLAIVKPRQKSVSYSSEIKNLLASLEIEKAKNSLLTIIPSQHR